MFWRSKGYKPLEEDKEEAEAAQAAQASGPGQRRAAANRRRTAAAANRRCRPSTCSLPRPHLPQAADRELAVENVKKAATLRKILSKLREGEAKQERSAPVGSGAAADAACANLCKGLKEEDKAAAPPQASCPGRGGMPPTAAANLHWCRRRSRPSHSLSSAAPAG